jgi:hypothetical protein
VVNKYELPDTTNPAKLYFVYVCRRNEETIARKVEWERKRGMRMKAKTKKIATLGVV